MPDCVPPSISQAVFRRAIFRRIKYKSKMKAYYAQAGIPTARYHLVDTLEECEKFIKEVGYPVVVKPDNGVGASHTYKLEDPRSSSKNFFRDKGAG